MLWTTSLLRAEVPCYQRAAAVTGAAAGHEELLEGDAGEQWVAADGPDGGAKQRAAAAAGADDDIPTLGDEEAELQKVGFRDLGFVQHLLRWPHVSAASWSRQECQQLWNHGKALPTISSTAVDV